MLNGDLEKFDCGSSIVSVGNQNLNPTYWLVSKTIFANGKTLKRGILVKFADAVESY